VYVTGRIERAPASLFQYRAGRSYKDFQHPDFLPIFLDEVPPEDLASAERLCGTGPSNVACVFDFLATLDEAIATNTGKTTSDADAAVIITGRSWLLMFYLALSWVLNFGSSQSLRK